MSSLSNTALQDKLRKYFVPVWVSRDQYQLDPQSKDEHKEVLRIDRAVKDAHLPGGAVAVFVIAPDGQVVASQNLKEALDAKKLLAMLDDVVEKHQYPPRKEEAIKATTAPLRPLYKRTEKDSAILHVMTRFDGGRKHYGVSEDWLELGAAEVKQFLPDEKAERGDTWTIPAEVVEKIAPTFYPPGPNWRLQDSTVKKATLTGKLVLLREEAILIHLSGEVVVDHPFGKEAPGTTAAKVAGVLRYDPRTHQLLAFELASVDAVYAWRWHDKPQPEKVSIAVELEK